VVGAVDIAAVTSVYFSQSHQYYDQIAINPASSLIATGSRFSTWHFLGLHCSRVAARLLIQLLSG